MVVGALIGSGDAAFEIRGDVDGFDVCAGDEAARAVGDGPGQCAAVHLCP